MIPKDKGGDIQPLGPMGKIQNVSKRTQESGQPLSFPYSRTELIPHEIGWGSYCLKGRMHGKSSVIGRTVSPLTTCMPKEADRIQFLTWARRTSFHFHIVVVFLTQEKAWPQEVTFYLSLHELVWCVIFLHVGAILIILRRLGNRCCFIHELWVL